MYLEEVWKDVEEFKGLYQVSSLGRVKSIRSKKPHIMTPHLINSGYLKYTFKIEGTYYNRLAHRLVAKEFCEGYEEEKVVNHKDANRLNNRAENLEWVTTKENIGDCIKRGTHDVISAHKVAHKKRRRPAKQTTLSGEYVAEYPSAREAAKEIGVHENCVSRVCRGERKHTAGFRFIYLDSR